MPDLPTLVPIEELNRLPCAHVAEAVQVLLEAGGALADALCQRRPYRDYAALLDQAEPILGALPEADQIATLNAHPRIGTSAALLRRQLGFSYQEQGSAPAPDAAEVDGRLADLNEQYEARFGFRFVVFVDRRPRAAIIPVLEARLGNTRDQELATGRAEVLAIARDRLAVLGGVGLASSRAMDDDDSTHHPARRALLHELHRSALEVYGEERVADPALRVALELATTAVWRVMGERLDPLLWEPYPRA
jgi:2-oxo-4-hydroxy-4-carboxy--5-ureidoimidazoline (OHCU) decarboxylase